MIVAINYADAPYKKAQHYNTKTAYKIGRVDKVIEYGPEDIDSDYLKKHDYAFILNDKRAGKFCLWRPRILKKTYEELNQGDYLIYADSGSYYYDDVHKLIEVMDRDKLDIMVFEDTNYEKAYSKRDIFVYLKADTDEFADSYQRISTFFILRKSDKADEFVDEYYRLTDEAPYLFTDEENRLGKDNYEGFIDTRHNQSIFSLITKRMGVPAYRDPSQWGIYRELAARRDGTSDEVLYRSTFPRIFTHHRQKKVNPLMQIKLERMYKRKKQEFI